MITLLLVGIVTLLLSWVVWLTLPTTRRCPDCGSETVALRTRLSRRLRGWVLLRWCMRCGWQGLARPKRPTASRRRIEAGENGGGEERSGASRGS